MGSLENKIFTLSVKVAYKKISSLTFENTYFNISYKSFYVYNICIIHISYKKVSIEK